jgi:CHAT domain-containing protein
LVDIYSVSYLTSGRVLILMIVRRDSEDKPLIVADPVFGEPSVVTGTMNGRRKQMVAVKRHRSSTVVRSMADTYFAPLGATTAEANSIKSLFPDSRILSGRNASEASLKQAVAPQMLHIATHGFFLPDRRADQNSSSPLPLLNSSTNANNPMARSGLAFAGANVRNQIGDDGILTAMEASALNLWGTKLVVLSACDTGVGEVRNGEGVYGLRRAFVIAGAESLVMSMWPVSDNVTRELMTGYYKNLRRGRGRSESLRSVQLEMLKRPSRKHPFYWASFILAGEGANLDGKR